MDVVLKIKTKDEDMDEVGHVNNIKYVSYLEQARKKWYEYAGIPFDEMQKRNIGTVILKLDIMFLKEARLGDTLEVITKPIKIGNKSFVLKQDIYNQRNELLTEATVTSVMFDTAARESIKVLDEIACQFESKE
ncbi:acyl-CoA thioesterase [Anaerobacillus sp. MEB173]|uniref:acyl-CoA thioesterase n=1 Tax=Anaerobacillus sp. MEB173 TaxID=3383345 RepID=UPI003F903B8F